MPSSTLLTPCLTAALLLLALCRPALAGVADEVQRLVSQGDLARALGVAQAAVTADPRDAQARFQQAVVLMDLRRDEEAVAAYTRLSQEYPELPEPHNNLALLHARGGQWELARQSLLNALRNDPSHRVARANLGEVYLMLAVQAWEQAAAAGPLDPRLMRKLDAARALVSGVAGPAAAAR